MKRCVDECGYGCLCWAMLSCVWLCIALWGGGGCVQNLEWQNLVLWENLRPVLKYDWKIWYKIPRLWLNKQNTARKMAANMA